MCTSVCAVCHTVYYYLQIQNGCRRKHLEFSPQKASNGQLVKRNAANSTTVSTINGTYVCAAKYDQGSPHNASHLSSNNNNNIHITCVCEQKVLLQKCKCALLVKFVKSLFEEIVQLTVTLLYMRMTLMWIFLFTS